jgi:hypothetical protein
MERCLTLEEISAIVDFIREQWGEPNSSHIDHVIECPKCRQEVMEIIEIYASGGDDDDDVMEEEDTSEFNMTLCMKYLHQSFYGNPFH